MNQTLFVSNKHIIHIIMQLLHNNFFFLYVIFLCGKDFSRSFGSTPHIPYFQDKIQLKFTLYLWHWGLGLWCSPLKEMRFQKLTPYYDYYTAYNIRCDPLVVLMVHGMISLGGCFPSLLISLYLLNYYWNGILITITIHFNLFWLLIITSNNFIEKAPPPPESFILIVIYWRMIFSYC